MSNPIKSGIGLALVLVVGCVPGVSLDQLDDVHGQEIDSETADGDGTPPDSAEVDGEEGADDVGPDDAFVREDGVADEGVAGDDGADAVEAEDGAGEDGGRPDEICTWADPATISGEEECAGGLGAWMVCGWNMLAYCYPHCRPDRTCPPGAECRDNRYTSGDWYTYCYDPDTVTCGCYTSWRSWYM